MTELLERVRGHLQVRLTQLNNLLDNLVFLFHYGRKALFLILVAVFTVTLVVDYMTMRIHYHARIVDVVNNSETRYIKVRIPINPDAPENERKYTVETFSNEARWKDLSFDPYVIETIANTMKENDMSGTIQISWDMFSKEPPNLNNLFVADAADPDDLVDKVMAQRWRMGRFFKPDYYLRSGGDTEFPRLVIYGTMVGGWMFLIVAAWFFLFKFPGLVRRVLAWLWSWMINFNWLEFWHRSVARFRKKPEQV